MKISKVVRVITPARSSSTTAKLSRTAHGEMSGHEFWTEFHLFAVVKMSKSAPHPRQQPMVSFNTPFSGVWVNQSSIPTTSLSIFRAIVAVGGVGGNSLGSIFAILRSRKLRMSALLDVDA